ncbi:MAG: PKD domain-containing protein [Candidatus Krumholzibacteria bacterium]|nr:PKD domain-containing protein [Candidatus Krumholzibacteria bacterium]
MKRACMLLVPALLILVVATGCKDDDQSVPAFTRLQVTPACGVAPMAVEGYAVLSGGNESGDPLGANNNLEILWNFGDGGIGSTTRDFHTYHTPGEYTVTVKGTDPDGQTASATFPVVVFPDSLVVEAGSDFPDGNVTTDDIIHFNIMASSCDIDYPTVLGDSVKMVFKWEMGDDAASEFKLTAPEFRYDIPGDYEVNVSVFYPAWAVLRKQTLKFTVTPGT